MLSQKLKFLSKSSSPSTSKKLDHQQLRAPARPIAQASTGQHARHSTGRMERAVLTVDDPKLMPMKRHPQRFLRMASQRVLRMASQLEHT